MSKIKLWRRAFSTKLQLAARWGDEGLKVKVGLLIIYKSLGFINFQQYIIRLTTALSINEQKMY